MRLYWVPPNKGAAPLLKFFVFCNRIVVLPLHHRYRYRYFSEPYTVSITVIIDFTYVMVTGMQQWCNGYAKLLPQKNAVGCMRLYRVPNIGACVFE
jgi:hypothetical protein